MIRKSEIEMERAKIIRVSRALIRLKHSILADQELNESLPDTILEFDKGIQEGELRTLPDSLFRDILET